ncbi:MAG: haloacid dehalogenase-like hydrolase [Burkholderiales bacterium]
MLRIGVDFDNTIVCYDRVFHRAAVEQGLIPPETAADKNSVRDYLRAQGGEEHWIALQGEVYGKRMLEADPFPGFLAFAKAAQAAGAALLIVSHKTRIPFKGPAWDLHQAARDWIAAHLGNAMVPPENVFFELTKDAKLGRIAQCGCTHFIDDLPEILTAPAFPAGTRGLLFDPAGHFAGDSRYVRMHGWPVLSHHFAFAGAQPA